MVFRMLVCNWYRCERLLILTANDAQFCLAEHTPVISCHVHPSRSYLSFARTILYAPRVVAARRLFPGLMPVG